MQIIFYLSVCYGQYLLTLLWPALAVLLAGTSVTITANPLVVKVDIVAGFSTLHALATALKR